nr:MAG TPA: hypothetical protein [Bacteriophage sp.]
MHLFNELAYIGDFQLYLIFKELYSGCKIN